MAESTVDPKTEATASRTGVTSLFVEAVDRTAELSDDVLKSLESAQRGVIDAVRKFVESVDKALPPYGETRSKRQEVIDSAMDMVDRLVQSEHAFIRNVIDSSAKSLGGHKAAKPEVTAESETPKASAKSETPKASGKSETPKANGKHETAKAPEAEQQPADA